MPKRFTDTDKWRDEWYGSLSNDNRIIWQYLLDNCTNAGIFKKDWRLLRFQCNTIITEEDFKKVFEGRVIDCGNFFFLPKFLKFQNKKGLNSNKPAIVSIREEIIQNNLTQIVHESLGNDFLTIKGKGIGKGKDTEEETGKEELEEEEKQTVYEPADLREIDPTIVKLAADLTDALCDLFQVRPIVTSILYNSICEYITALCHRNEVQIATLALQKYMSYKARSQEQKHNITSWIGTKNNHFQDGQWIMIDWEAKLKNYEAVQSLRKTNGKEVNKNIDHITGLAKNHAGRWGSDGPGKQD
jgi:hypothetical protein